MSQKESFTAVRVSVSKFSTGLVQGIVVGPDGLIYVATEPCISRIGKDLEVECYAGQKEKGMVNGPRLEAKFNFIRGMCFVGPRLMACDASDQKIREVNIDTNQVTTYAGTIRGLKDGPRLAAQFHWPTDIAFYHNCFFITDMSNGKLRMIDEDGMVSTIGGQDRDAPLNGPWESVFLHHPTALAVTQDRLFVSDDRYLGLVREIVLENKTFKTLINGNEQDTGIRSSFAICPTPDGDLVLTDADHGHLHHVSLSDGSVTPIVAQRAEDSSSLYKTSTPTFACVDPATGNLWWSESNAGRVVLLEHRFASFWSFESILENPGPASDVEFRHASTLQNFQLHSQMIQSLVPEFTSAQALDTLDVPIENLKLALSILCGCFSAQMKILTADPVVIAHVYAVYQAFGATTTTPVQKWLRSWFVSRVNTIKRFSAFFPVFESLKTSSSAKVFEPLIPIVLVYAKKLSTDSARSELQSLVSGDVLTQFLNGLDAAVDTDGDSPENHPILPTKILQLHTEAMASELKFVPRSTTEPATSSPARFRIGIAGSNVELEVVTWLATARWPYFRSMQESGFEESRVRRVELPSDFPPDLLLEVVRYIYTSKVAHPKCVLAEMNYLRSNGGQFGFLQLDGEPAPGFVNLFQVR